MKENSGGRETEDGFCHLGRGSQRCETQSGVEETNLWPHYPGGELGLR